MFDNIREQNFRAMGTPVKKRKLNKVSAFEESEDQDLNLNLGLNRKKSLIDCFHFIGAINRKDSYKLPMLRKQSIKQTPFNPFDSYEMDQQPKNNFNSLIPQNFNFEMDIQKQGQKSAISSSSQEQLPKDIRLIKRVTMINPTQMYMGPKLFRCNSGIQIQQQINQSDERKYGDNIYLQQINKLKRRSTIASKHNKQNKSQAANKNFKQNYNKKIYQQDSDYQQDQVQERLLKDYQISSNLHAYARHHENYLCLNKLERIFYYIKKINFSDEYPEEEIFQLLQQQIKLYNRDDQSRMLRFYQSWQEEDCIYLVFQTASTSIQEKLESGMKLRQNQVWSLLIDCCQALNWMKQFNQYHLNIKPGNILKCREKYKLSDPFLNSNILSRALCMFKGQQFQQQKLKLTFSYVAPQIMEFRPLIQGLDFQKCDIFSLGLCILQNITGISVNILRRDLTIIKKNNQKYLKGYSPALRNLLVKMVNTDPTKRPNSQQIKSIKQIPLVQTKLKQNVQNSISTNGKQKRKLSL